MSATLHIDFLHGDARTVAERVITDESARADHIVVALSGSHAYGFPSPDRDLDLKAVHVIATDRLLGLGKPNLSFNRLEVIDGVEIDYTSNELGAVLAGILSGNGNYAERVLGPLLCASSPELSELAELTRGALSQRVYHHYRGFARTQLAAVDGAERPTAKKLLYVLRTALTGAHLLLTGELVTDVAVTAAAHGIDGVDALIAIKREGERVALASGDAGRWRGGVQAALDLLEAAPARSCLPETPRNYDQIDDWLIALRRRR